MTVEQILEETRQWPAEKISELLGRITNDLHSTDPAIEAAWKAEIQRRIEEIETGNVQLIPAEEVFARARAIIDK